MSQTIQFEVEMPEHLAGLKLPAAVHRRLQFLLDAQDSGRGLSEDQRGEAEGLVELSELLSLLKLRAQRIAGES
ncbi:hypothetical protein Pla175_05260 [Pirellulimonas nuda]|uniref:Uncharacterized protein n=1 Tax=Pirellulimonas nuda TaxID=2528009 RepID=A0A518D6R6_9BACT|nr:hypothetical protein Pla175_05260 [Pirellulimonas nuda]